MERTNRMSNPVIGDFVITLYVFKECVMSESIITKTIAELNQYLNVRAVRNAHYFDKNESIKSSYKFIKKNVDFFFPPSI